MWNLTGPGIEPTCPALADKFLTTEPPEKSLSSHIEALTFSVTMFGDRVSKELIKVK